MIEMFYESTRGKVSKVKSSEVIIKGIAEDGGLFVPSKKPSRFSLKDIDEMVFMEYKDRAFKILSKYLTDFKKDELMSCILNAYSTEKFNNKSIVPLYKLNDNMNILELWHGPTSAFKDIALQILPHLLVKSIKKNKHDYKVIILVATSGDTGKSALEGFSDVDGTEIIVFYPNDGVSEIQKLQMITQKGNNVSVIGVNGNFDDTQTGVKKLFTDKELIYAIKEKNFKFSSANSINWGRLVPQIVYYFSAYLDMLKNDEIKLGEAINIVVPTGNFGNILAAYYALELGLPVNKLICASNENKVLTEFINTGRYNKNREFKRTLSPSMDILISSNLERLLYEFSGHNSQEINWYMDKLNEFGEYEVKDVIREKFKHYFWADWCSDKKSLETIRSVYEEYNYLVDTHTAVGIDVYDKYVISTGDISKTILASTASPYKFNSSVYTALCGKEQAIGKKEYDLMIELEKITNNKIPYSLKSIVKEEILHKNILKKSDMKLAVEAIIYKNKR